MSITKIAPPHFSESGIKKIVLDLYGLKVSTRSLVSDIGQNFHLTAEDGEEYIFKIANPAETFLIIEAQNEVLRRLAGKKKILNIPGLFPHYPEKRSFQ